MSLRLGDIAQVSAGQAAPKKFSNEGLPFIRAGHLEELINGIKLDSLPKVSENIAKELRLKKIPKGTILFAKSGMSATKNRIYITDQDSYYVSHLASISPGENFDNSFIARFLSWYKPSKLILDSAYPSIRLEDINNLKIPLPPLQTQIQIAAILDNAAALRDKTEQLLKEYDLLAQSIFLDMFGDPAINPKGWKKRLLVELSPIKKTSILPENIEDNTNYVGLDSIEKVTGEIHNVQKVYANELKSNKYKFTKDYILYGKLRPYLNKVANPNFSGICSTDIITLLPNQNLSNKAFITNYLKGKWQVVWANSNTSGANLPRLNLSAFSKLRIINPPIELQNQFAEKIALIEQQKELAKQELKESEDLFNCLLQKAFKGEFIQD